MASLAFPAIFSSPLRSTSATQTKSSQLSQKPSSVLSAASFSLSNRFSLIAYSNSVFFRNGLSLLLSSPDGFAVKDRSSARKIYARAAADKTIHDYTVKATELASLTLDLFVMCSNQFVALIFKRQIWWYFLGVSCDPVADIDGKNVSLSKFEGKILLIVNVASQCGLTSSNYKELSHLYEKYKTQGFEILAFPCNQFGGQEPGSNQDIKQFACTRFKAEFPIFDKVDVNGPNTAPIYQFMKSSSGGLFGDLVKWNFEKFLADKNGKVVQRYPPTTSPLQIEKDIKKLLAA